MNNGENTRDIEISLNDGRRLGVAQFGKIKGYPILAFHGTPGSRIWFKDDDEISHSLGVRLITVDRPGYGLSDPKQGRRIIDFNDDIKELAEFMNLDKFSVLGVSGGGVYAAALATEKNLNIVKTGLVSSASEFAKGQVPPEMCRPNKMAIFLSKWVPWLLRYSYKQQKYVLENMPDRYLKAASKNLGHLARADQEILQRQETIETMAIQMKEAFRKSPNEAVNELKMISTGWGFNCEDVQGQVEIWHGTEDTLSPLSGIKKLAKKIPDCSTNYIEGKGHFLDEDEDIWERILMSLLK